MRRKLILCMLTISVFSFAACGSENSSTPSSQTNIQNENEEKKNNNKQEVSMEALRNHEESPTSDFQFRLASGNYEIEKYLGDDEIVVIPEEYEGKKVVGIGSKVFGEGSGVKAVKLSDSVEYIAGSFFQNKDLEYVICGSGLKEIRKTSFSGCSSLKELELNEGLEKIEATSFSSITSLNELYIPESVIEIAGPNFVGISVQGFTIKGKAGSCAEKFVTDYGAPQYGHTFEAVE